MEKDDVLKQWERILTPCVLRSNLIIASVYIVSFEVLKSCIEDRIRDFFWEGWDGEKDIINPEYQTKVLSRKGNKTFASLDWLIEQDAIANDDVATYVRVKNYRNKIAHEMITFLTNGFSEDLPVRFIEILTLLNKIEKWWIVNFEIPINPELNGQEIDEDGILPGSVSQLKMMMDIAMGTDEQAEYYIKGFIEKGLIKPTSD